MKSDFPHSRAGVLRPVLLVAAGLAVLGTAGTLLLHDRAIDTVPPAVAPPPVQQASPTPAIPKPDFDIVRINPSGDAVMAGRAAPGSTVIIANDGNVLGEARADQNGDWVFVPQTRLPPGARELTLTERLPDGNEVKGERSAILNVPAAETGPAAAPALAVVTGPGTAPQVLTDSGAASARSGQLGLGAVEYDEHGELRLSGTAKPGTTVRLYADDRPLGEVTADANGAWAFFAGKAISPGTRGLRLDQIAPDGTVSSRVERPLAREALAAADLPPGHVTIRPGQNLWVIARRTYGHGIRYLVIYQANRQQIRDPNRIYPGQMLSLPGAAGTPPMPASSSTSR